VLCCHLDDSSVRALDQQNGAKQWILPGSPGRPPQALSVQRWGVPPTRPLSSMVETAGEELGVHEEMWVVYACAECILRCLNLTSATQLWACRDFDL
jgi:hypothetical protein